VPGSSRAADLIRGDQLVLHGARRSSSVNGLYRPRLTGPHTAFTDLSTDPAVLMVGGVAPTLLTTLAASCSADIQHPPDDLLV
jgi:hypothetical protein